MILKDGKVLLYPVHACFIFVTKDTLEKKYVKELLRYVNYEAIWGQAMGTNLKNHWLFCLYT